MLMTSEELLNRLEEVLSTTPSQADLADLLEDVQPFDLAQALVELPESQALHLLSVLDPVQGAEVLEHVDYVYRYQLLDHTDQPIAQEILREMSSDVVVDMVGAIHPKQAKRLLGLLPPETVPIIERLMRYPETTAGGRMKVEYISVRRAMTVAQVLEHIRKVGRDAETVAYIYVVDPTGRLAGVVSLRELIVERPETPIVEIMNSLVVSVPASLDQEEVARIVSQYDLVAVPVVNDQGKLVGIITVDDLVDVIHDEATEDIHKLGGSQPLTDSYFQTPVPMLVRKRIGWILVLFLAEAFTGTVLRHFEHVLEQAVSLTFFIPLLIGTGGNTGSQVVATLVRGLGVGEVKFRDVGRVLVRELITGSMIGVIMAGATMVRAYTLGVGQHLGPVVALTALFIVIWASIVSAVLPLLLHRLRVDPAVVSGPFISTLVDGTGLFMYFTVARLLLNLG